MLFIIIIILIYNVEPSLLELDSTLKVCKELHFTLLYYILWLDQYSARLNVTLLNVSVRLYFKVSLFIVLKFIRLN